MSACWICSSPGENQKTFGAYRRTFARKPWSATLTACQSCGHVSIDPQPTAEELAPFYSQNYHVFSSKAMNIDEAADQFRQGGEERHLHVRVVPGSDYLDVGCGIGDQVALMSALGVKARGVELNPIAAGLCRDRGLDVHCGTLDDAAFPDETFDAISLTHVLEHIPDPLPLLATCFRILKRGGELVIAVPNVRSLIFEKTGRYWINLDLPRHLHHFSPSSLRKAVAVVGFPTSFLTTESYEGLVEASLIELVHRRTFLPRGLIRKSNALRSRARRLTRESSADDRGDVIVVRASKA